MSSPVDIATGSSAKRGCLQLNEWHTLAVALPGALTTGFIYCYSTYSNALQDAFGVDVISESAKELIGIAPILMNLITFTCGMLMDATSVWFCCLLGGVIMFVSNAMSGAIALKYIDVGNPVIWFFSMGALMDYGAAFMVAATFSVIMKNFDGERRSALVGIGKSWVGASSGVGTAIFMGLFPCSETSHERLYFLWFVAIITGAIPICIAPFLRPLPPDQPKAPDNFLMPESQRLSYLFSLSVVLIALTLLSTLLEGAQKEPNSGMGIAFSAALIGILVTPFFMLLPRGTARGANSGRLMDVGPASPAIDPVVSRRTSSPWEGGPRQMLRHLSFHFIWFCAFALQSGGLFLVSNLGSMVESRTGPAVPSSTIVTVFSCSQGFARLLTGTISNVLLQRRLPRTWYFTFISGLMAAAHFVLCLPGPAALYVGTALAGWSFGSTYPLLVLVIGEVFGNDRFASNYMILDGTPGACGSLIFAKLLAESVYNGHAGSDGKCYGDECFRVSHVVIAVAQLVSLLMSIFLSLRARPVYRTISQQFP